MLKDKIVLGQIKFVISFKTSQELDLEIVPKLKVEVNGRPEKKKIPKLHLSRRKRDAK